MPNVNGMEVTAPGSGGGGMGWFGKAFGMVNDVSMAKLQAQLHVASGLALHEGKQDINLKYLGKEHDFIHEKDANGNLLRPGLQAKYASIESGAGDYRYGSTAGQREQEARESALKAQRDLEEFKSKSSQTVPSAPAPTTMPGAKPIKNKPKPAFSVPKLGEEPHFDEVTSAVQSGKIKHVQAQALNKTYAKAFPGPRTPKF